MKTKILTFAFLFLGLTVATAQYDKISNLLNRMALGVSLPTIDPITGHKVIFCYGGENLVWPGPTIVYYKDLIKVDIETFEYTTIANNVTGDIPPNMIMSRVSVFNGKIFVYSGKHYDDNGHIIRSFDSAVYIYDPATNHWTLNDVAPNVINRTKMAVVEDGNKVHLIGGTNTDGSLSDQYQIYDMSTNTVTPKTNINMGGRDGAASLKHNDKIYLIGGRTDYGVSGDILVYDLINNFWSMTSIIGDFVPSYNAILCGLLNGDFILSWGGLTSGSGKKSTRSGKKSTNSDVISTSLYKIYFDAISNQLVSQELENDLPPLTDGVGWLDIEAGDTIIYTFSGISSITNSGDTTLNTNFYRYNITNDLVQQYDTVNQSWGGIISSINETEFKISEELTIYPNPASETININLNNNETINTIKIFNQNGQLIRIIRNLTNNSIQINDLNSGLYFVRVDTDSKYYCGKIMKQ